MSNKIQASEPPRSRLTFSRNQKNNCKITQFVVNKLLKQQSSTDINNHCSSYILSNMIPKSKQINNKQSISLKRDCMKTQQNQPRIEYVTRHTKTRTRWYCEPNLQTDAQNQKKKSFKSYKVVMPDRPQEFRRAIADRIRHIVKKNQKEQSQESFSLVNFGLSISQIKTLEAPQKQIQKEKTQSIIKKQRQNKNNTQMYVSKQHDNLQRCKQKKTKSFTQPCNNKDLFIRKLDETNNQKHSMIFQKSQQSINFKLKIIKMISCLDLFLNSFHCKLISDKVKIIQEISPKNKKDKQKYHFYIGKGNNANLIRSLLKKRGWWSQTDHVNNAHFVWTQTKVPDIMQKLEVFNDQNWITDIVLFDQQPQINQQTCMKTRKLKRTKSKIFLQSSKPKQIALNQIFHQRQHKAYHNLLSQKQADYRLNKIKVPQVLHNHYQNNYMFGNKNALYYNLSEYYKFLNQDLADIMPLTFYLQKDNKKVIKQFETVFNQSKRTQNIWVLKPAQNSNRGAGIQITDSLTFIKAKLASVQKLIVQSYIKNLMLYNYRKFDIRTYMLCLTINGRHKFYWYEQGYLRTASQPYNLSNLNDQLIHLTNDAIQKQGDNYSKYQEGNKLSYSQFQRYLDNKFPKQKWKVTKLHDKMKQLAKKTVKAIYPRIDSKRKKYGFELFGLDFIVTNQFRPYLIEINTNSCLQLCSGVLQRLIPRMMQNMFRLTIDPLFRPNPEHCYSKNQSYYLYDQTFLDRNKFSLIFDQKYDCDFEWQDRCKKLKGWEWTYCQDQQFTDQGSFINIDY